MITLITGAPGAGKSAALVDLLRTLAKGRAVYVSGVPDLTVEHIPLEEPKEWPSVVPDGAAVVIDEVQRVWRPRGPGQKVPDHVSALETHRHRGLDFFIVTQGPDLLDKNVRALVGRHIHLRDVGVLGRWWYEWPEISQNLAWKTAPIKKRYKLPRSVFSLYKSASVHVKPIRSFPMAVVFGGLALVAMVFFGVKSVMAVKDKVQPGAVAGASAASGVPLVPGPIRRAQPRTEAEWRAQASPPVHEWPETAPRYDEVRKVVRMPRIMGGYCMGGECRCYIQDGLRAPIDMKACFEWIRNPPFDPYYAPVPPANLSAPVPAQAASQPSGGQGLV